MPNWCSNVLTWDADDVTTAAIFAAVSKDLGDGKVCYFSYDSILPQPPEVLESLDMFWYEWRAENWGCKWDNDCEVQKIDHGFSFESPWAPPTPIMQHLAKKFPGVSFCLQYVEPGMEFCGECTAYYEPDCEVSIETNHYDASDDPAGYLEFQKGSMDNDSISYNGQSIIYANEVYTDTGGKFYLLGSDEVDKDNFDASTYSIEPCEGEDCAQIVHEYYSIESVGLR